MKRELFKLSRNAVSAVLFFVVFGCFFAVMLVYLLNVNVRDTYELDLVPHYESPEELKSNTEALREQLSDAEIQGRPANTIAWLKKQIIYSEFLENNYVPYPQVVVTSFPLYAANIIPVFGSGVATACTLSHVVAVTLALVLFNSEYIGGTHKAFYAGVSRRRKIAVPKCLTVLLFTVLTAAVIPALSLVIGIPFGAHFKYVFFVTERSAYLMRTWYYLAVNWLIVMFHAECACAAACGISLLIKNVFAAGAVSAVAVIGLPVVAQSLDLPALTAAFIPVIDTGVNIPVTLLCKAALALCCAGLLLAGAAVHRKRDL